MVKIRIIMPSYKKLEDEDDHKLEDKAASAVPETPTKMNITTPSLINEELDGKVEKAASVPQLPTKPRTERNSKTKTMETIMKKSAVRKVKLDPEALREKIAGIKYSRDYSFLFSVDEPVVRKSPPVKYPTEAPRRPAAHPKPTPLKHSTQASRQPAAERKSPPGDKFQRRTATPSMSQHQMSASHRHWNYSTEDSSQNVIKTNSQLGWRETARDGVKQQDRGPAAMKEWKRSSTNSRKEDMEGLRQTKEEERRERFKKCNYKQRLEGRRLIH